MATPLPERQAGGSLRIEVPERHAPSQGRQRGREGYRRGGLARAALSAGDGQNLHGLWVERGGTPGQNSTYPASLAQTRPALLVATILAGNWNRLDYLKRVPRVRYNLCGCSVHPIAVTPLADHDLQPTPRQTFGPGGEMYEVPLESSHTRGRGDGSPAAAMHSIAPGNHNCAHSST